MDVELVTDETSEDEHYGLDDNNEDYLNFEGERCGICMDIVIDRGVLDCCHHCFCFSCIDNWATITSLCPLCQHEFQMITCVPVYDTIGGNKSDEDTGPRDEDWLVEGKNNTLSFPSYYIDENSVVCLEGDGCQVRSGSADIEENSDIDTSIACDSCDKWFHAFCVGFDAEGICYGSWLCPRCSTGGGAQKSDIASGSGKSSHNSLDITNGDGVAETSFSGKVSVCIAGDGETAVVVSLDEDKRSLETSESVMDCSKDMNNSTPLFINNMLNSGTIVDDRITIETNPSCQDVEVKSRDDSCSSLHSFSPVQPKIDADFVVERANIFSENRLLGSCIDPALLSPIRSYMPDMENNGATEDRMPASDKCHSPAENMVHSLESMVPDEEESEYGNTGGKRKCTDISSKGDSFRDVDEGEAEAEAGNDPKISRKKIKAERNSRPINKMDEAAQSVAFDSFTIPSSDTSNNSIPKQNSIPNITDIIRETDKKSLKKHKRPISSLMNPEEREMAAGFRLKKIMRRGGDNDKDSSALVQEIRKTIREAIRNKSSEELGQNLFDPKLLDALRAALASSGTENRKPTLDLKAKSLLLQKGKVRESLTKKIYGSGGKRKRAWTRECEVEFWKHRCAKATKPEKVQALKSVLDLLRENTDGTKEKPVNENEGKGSILSRLYLADTSVFPRKNDIRPVSAVEIATEQNQKSGSSDKFSKLLTGDSSQREPPNSNNLLQANVTVSRGEELKGSIKAEVSHGDADRKKHLKGTSNSLLSGNKASSEKETESKPDVKKNDRRKWALELLARKSATSDENMQEKEEDNAILKGKYTLLAQLPKDMRPVLAPSCHNKISISIRQAQLYRLTEHFLKKANLSVVCRSAEIELAVADAVNIEKQVADKSNSKLVYVNLCSQELLRRSDGVKVDGAKEVDPCSTSECLLEETAPVDTSPVDLQVDEALRNAGLMSDSPPNSPLIHRTTEPYNEAGSPGKVEDDDPEDIFKVDTRSEFDIYGDFEYNFDDDDDHIIRLGPPKVSDAQSQQPKIKLLFSSLMPEKPDERSDLQDHVSMNNEAALDNSAETKDQTSAGVISLNSKLDDCVIQNSSANKDNGLSLAECEELYGPDKPPLIEKYPDRIPSIPVNSVLPEQKSNDLEKNPDNSGHAGDASKQSPSNSHKNEKPNKKEKTTKGGRSQSEPNSSVVKKVEAYIKEHIRPLCKSGVITVEQYRWAVGKATEKVMKYHSKETNANFLIKEGEKVKKLAEQYVEASQKGKS